VSDPFEDLILDEQTVSAPSILHNREAEEAVIGSVLINPNCLFDLLPILKADYFYIHRHRWIWDVFIALDFRATPIDLVTVTEELNRRGQLSEIGGAAYLTALITQVPSSMNAVHYGEIVKSHYARRQLINAANTIAGLAYNESKDLQECVIESVQATSALEVLGASRDNFIELGQLLGDVMDDVEQRSKNPKDVWGFSTGLPKFDKKTGGLQQGELTYLVGAPGVGKTWFDLGLSIEMGKQAPGCVISLEMSRNTVGKRFLSGMSGVSTRAMKSGNIQDDDWPLMTSALEKSVKYKVWIDDSSYDTDKLRATLARAKSTWGIQWFTLDYALLLLDRGKDETEQSKNISAGLKWIVKELNLCGVVLHSVTKIGMGGKDQPMMSNQRGSGQAIHDPDLQLFLTPLYEKDNQVKDLPKSVKDKMATLWCTKGRELEESRFKMHLIRQGDRPFWGEFSDDNKPRY
jgi:replicative DNA helicase